MTDTDTSFLADIAKIEQCEIEKTEKLRAKCRAQVEEARQEAQAGLAAIPTKLQEERQKITQETQDKTGVETSEMLKSAEALEAKIEATATSLEGDIFTMVLAKILPNSSGGQA